MNLKITNEFKNQFTHLKFVHFSIVRYLVNWAIGNNSPRTVNFGGRRFFWINCRKLADDLDLSVYMVRRALYRLENKDKNVNFGKNEPLLFSKIVYEKEKQTKLYLSFNFKLLKEMFVCGDDLLSILSCKMGVSMPALFDVNSEKKNYSEKAEEIVRSVLNNNSDLFKTRIAKIKAFTKCCTIVQDIYNGLFTNQRIYDVSKNIKTNQFDFGGWKDSVNAARNDWGKVRDLIECAIGNYRMMFEPRNMPSNKSYLPKSLDKWLYDETNDNGYPSYFVFSLKKPKPQRIQYADNEAERMFNELPERLQKVGEEVCRDNAISNKFVFYSNLTEMYDWCKWLVNSNINDNIDYWVTSPAEIISKFVDYCDLNNIVVNEHTFNIRNSLNNNAPFAWFISIAISEHRLNKKILKSCA